MTLIASGIVVSSAQSAAVSQPSLCNPSTTSRVVVSDKFPLAECFNGGSVTIKNTTPLMIVVGSQGTTGPFQRKPDSADAAGLAAAAVDTLPFRLPPNFQTTAPVGSGAAAFSVQIAPDENRYFWMRYLEGLIPVDAFGDYEAVSHFGDSMNGIVTSHSHCEQSASNFIFRAECVAKTAASIQLAVEYLSANLLLTSSKTIIKELRSRGLISAATKSIGLLISTAITIAQSDASLFVDNLEESKFLGAPDIMRISAGSANSTSACNAAAIQSSTGSTVVGSVRCSGGWALASVAGTEGETLFQTTADSTWKLVSPLAPIIHEAA
jgi:hypothetical protein